MAGNVLVHPATPNMTCLHSQLIKFQTKYSLLAAHVIYAKGKIRTRLVNTSQYLQLKVFIIIVLCAVSYNNYLCL